MLKRVTLIVAAVALAMPVCAALSTQAQAADLCAPLPLGDGEVINVSTAEELWQAVVADKTPDRIILLADGTYDLGTIADVGHYFWIDTPGLSIRSASGDRDSVILDGGYRQNALTLVASDITVADLTVTRSRTIGIHVISSDKGDTLNTTIHNVRIVDPGEHAFKANRHEKRVHYSDNGTIACSHFELTDKGRQKVLELNGDCYTGGINIHLSRGWHVHDNIIEGFWCPTGLSEHAAVFKTGSRDTVVERNRMINNARGIGFVLYDNISSHTAGVRTYSDNPCPEVKGSYIEHYGGVIRNNFIYADNPKLFASEAGHDSGINLWHACGAKVLHNTVFSTQKPFSSIEWRWPNTTALIANNLVSHNLMTRQGAKVEQKKNITTAPASLFADASRGDLHIKATARQAIDRAAELGPKDCPDDMDGEVRPAGAAADIRADEHVGG